MPAWLCKIWRIIANVLGAIVDLIMAVVKSFADLIIEVLSDIGGGLFGSPIVWIGLAALAWWLWPKDDDKDQQEDPPPADSYFDSSQPLVETFDG